VTASRPLSLARCCHADDRGGVDAPRQAVDTPAAASCWCNAVISSRRLSRVVFTCDSYSAEVDVSG